MADPAAETVPSVLKDWVKKHRHVCSQYNPQYNPPAKISGVCQKCKWPYGAHEESWLDDTLALRGGYRCNRAIKQ